MVTPAIIYEVISCRGQDEQIAITLSFQPQQVALDKKAEILGVHHKLNPEMLRKVTPGPQPFRAFSRWWEVDQKLMTPAQVRIQPLGHVAKPTSSTFSQDCSFL